MQSIFTYEESVEWLRSQPEYSELVKHCYLDVDNLVAAERFKGSDEFKEIIKLLTLEEKAQKLKILDLGCGNGIASYAFASLGHDVIGVDPDLSDDVGLNAAQRLSVFVSNGSISTVQSFAEDLPFPDSTFDIIYERQALHHFSDLCKGVAECLRVLKPGGLFLATREHVISSEQQLDEFLSNHILHKFHGGENAYPLEVYTSAFKKAGFKKVKTFAPFETVINYFPLTETRLSDQLSWSLGKKIGNSLATKLAGNSFLTALYLRYLSHRCNDPGRLYSFLCSK